MFEICSRCLDAGACPNRQDPQGHSPLFLAYQKRQSSLIHQLCAKKAQLNPVDNSKLRLLDAIELFDSGTVECLINAGADVNAGPKMSPLLAVFEKKWTSAILLVVQKGGHLRESEDDGILCRAIKAEMPCNIIEALNFAGAGANTRDAQGRLPLEMAKAFFQVETVQFLLEC